MDYPCLLCSNNTIIQKLYSKPSLNHGSLILQSTLLYEDHLTLYRHGHYIHYNKNKPDGMFANFEPHISPMSQNEAENQRWGISSRRKNLW